MADKKMTTKPSRAQRAQSVMWEQPRERMFDGKAYRLFDTRRPLSKATAGPVLAHHRRFGSGARLVKVKGGYAVYIRG